MIVIRAKPSLKAHMSKAVKSEQMLSRELRHAQGTAPRLIGMMYAKTRTL